MKFSTPLMAGAALAAPVALLVALTQHATAAEVTLKAVTGLQQSNPITKSFLENYVAVVNKRGKGVVQIKYLGGQDVVPPRKASSAVKRGQFDMLHCPTAYYIGTVPEGYGLLASNQKPNALRKNGGFAILKEVYRKKAGTELIAWGESKTAYNTYLVTEPKFDKDGVPDLTGIKMRATGTYRPLFRALGASTINMKSSEIYTGLQRGVVKGFGWPNVGIVSLGLHKIVKYRIDPSYYQTNTVITMNMDKWNALSDKAKGVLNAVAQEYEKVSNEYMERIRADEDKTVRAAGVKVITLKGDAARKYLATAHGEIWKELDKRSEYAAKLRPKLYIPN